MPSTYSSLKIQLMATGENNTTWGNVTNVNLGTAIEEAIVGSADVTFASGNVTISLSDTNATQTARNMRLNCVGATGGSTRNLVVPSIEKPYIVNNTCADSILVKTSGGSGVTVPAGKTMWVYSDGTDVVDVVTHLTSLTTSGALSVNSTTVNVGTVSAPAFNFLSDSNTGHWSPGADIIAGSVGGSRAYYIDNLSTGTVALGAQAADSITSGTGTTGIGYQAATGVTTGARNTAVGSQAITLVTTGSDVTAVGAVAGDASTGSQNTYLGSLSCVGTTLTGSNNVLLGYAATPSGPSVSNTVTLGNSSIATLRCQVTTITSLSDKRDKTNIRPLGIGLDFVNRLNPVAFTWNTRDKAKVGVADTGFIAQDLLVVQEKESVHIPGLVDETNPDKLEAGYGKLLPVLVRAIQELSAEVDYLKSQVNGPY